MPDRPNILFLMSDEHRADVAGFAGNRVARTPTLDHLAETGVVFENAYTPSPICIPGRQAMMSGQFPRHCGCERYGQDLAPGYMTFARRFSQWAYNTVCSGKLHHYGPDQMQGWTQRLAPDTHLGEPFIEGREQTEFARYNQRDARWKWSDAMEIHRARADVRGRNQRFDNHATQAAVEFLEEYFVDMTYDRPGARRPLLLKLSLLQPHYPYVTDHEKLVYYFNRVEPFIGEPVFGHPFLSERGVRLDEEATEREIRRATAAYYGMVETIDAHYGRVLEALHEVGQSLDDWIVVYTSDHGEMLGEHGIWEKQKFFEGSARVPLIIRWPRRFAGGRTVTENVNLCDLFATLCDLAGLPVPDDLDSRSMVPLLEGTAQARQGWDNETVSQFGGRNLMIKRDHLKYQWYGTAQPEVLFDLAADPKETRNVVDVPQHADALRAFRSRRDALGFAPPP